MKAFGKIEAVDLKKEGFTRNGNKYENYSITFKDGEDVHLVDVTVFPGAERTGREVMASRGVVEGAVGDMEMRYSKGVWEGRTFRNCELKEFKEYQGRQKQDKPAPMERTPEQQAEVDAKVQAAQNDPEAGDKLPF